MVTLHPVDGRWNGRKGELLTAFNATTSYLKIVFGTINNGIFLGMGDAIDSVRKSIPYRHIFRHHARAVWQKWNNYERNLLHGDVKYFSVQHMTEECRSFYGENLTDRDYFEYWQGTTSTSYEQVRPFVGALANKYRLLLEANNIDNAKALGNIMAMQSLLMLAGDIFEHCVEQLHLNYGIRKEDCRGALAPFSLRHVLMAWTTMMNALIPQLKDVHPTPLEQKNIDDSKRQIFDKIDSNDFYFGGPTKAIEQFDEMFRTKGTMKKAMRTMAEARALFEENLKD